MTFGFLSGSQNFCNLLNVSWECAWIHWVAESCTTTAYRWLFRDSQLSLKTLRSTDIKSPKFSAPRRAPPLRLMHVTLEKLVLWQISQIRLLGKWVKTLCLPKSSRLFTIGSKEASWEELAWDSPCTGISSTTQDGEWLSCFMDVRKIHKDPEDELDKPLWERNSLFLQRIRIPFLMRCVFWPLTHS